MKLCHETPSQLVRQGACNELFLFRFSLRDFPILHVTSSRPFPRQRSVQSFLKSRWRVFFNLVFRRPIFLFPGIFVINPLLSRVYVLFISSHISVGPTSWIFFPWFIFLEASFPSHAFVPHNHWLCESLRIYTLASSSRLPQNIFLSASLYQHFCPT